VLFRGLSTFFTKPKPVLRTQFSRAMLHLPQNKRLYVVPQTLMKLSPAFDQVLHEILKKDDEAYLLMLYSSTQNVWKEKVRKRWREAFGKLHTRILFFSTMPYAEFMALLSTADVLLDPFPWGGGVTTLDALALGIPVVTLPSAQTVVQLAAGFFRYINVSDCIARDKNEFVKLAIAFAMNKAGLKEEVSAKITHAHRALYEDKHTLEEWNVFLSNV
jgi:protein O-GlcNAc transferase